MEFSQPPPDSGTEPQNIPNVNFNVPPPSMPAPPMMRHGGSYIHGAGKSGQPYFKPFVNFARGPGGLPMTQDDFDGKRLRKSVMRKTVDYNAAIIKALENRLWQRDFRDRRALQPESIYAPEMLPPPSYMDHPTNAVTTRFVKTATNKMRCPIFTLAWTPEGRRLVTGASSGEFTLWNGLTFNFETILQAHDVPVRTMVWSHNDNWMVTGDHGGYVKYWQSNMNNVRMFQAHKEPVRGISFSPSDSKFVSCSDDGTLRVWDFFRCQEEKVLRGHGADVKCVHWHPQKALIVSGSKDNQQPIKLWDPKSGQALATLHAHKSTVMDLKWNENGNWLITASRDHLLKLFDLRNLREEVQIFRGHKKEASAVSWHPIHEGLFCSGGSDGSILFWNVGTDKEVGAIDVAHDSIVWTLAWHPLGHILCSGSNDHTIKFWTRNRPGDQMRDKYNLNTLPAGLQGLEECDIDDNSAIPGMGPEDKIDFTESLTADRGFIPGLDLDTSNLKDRGDRDKKVPYSKPIPRNFQAQWNDTGRPDDDEAASKEIKEVITQIVENTSGIVPLQKISPSAIVVYGKMIPVQSGSKLEKAISDGPNALNVFISSGELEELNDVLPNVEQDYDSDSSFCDQNGKRIYDHNAQLVYDKDSTNQPSFIPPLMALNVQVGANGSDNRRNLDEYRNSNNNQHNSDRDEREIWQPNTMIPNPWGGSINPFSNNNMLHNGQNNMGNNNMMNFNKPPSLLNISIEPPDMSPNNNNQWDSNNRPRTDNFKGRDGKRRRDSEGRRISRFDNNDNRNRRPGPIDIPGAGGNNANNNNNINNNNNNGGRHRSGRSKRRNI